MAKKKTDKSKAPPRRKSTKKKSTKADQKSARKPDKKKTQTTKRTAAIKATSDRGEAEPVEPGDFNKYDVPTGPTTEEIYDVWLPQFTITEGPNKIPEYCNQWSVIAKKLLIHPHAETPDEQCTCEAMLARGCDILRELTGPISSAATSKGIPPGPLLHVVGGLPHSLSPMPGLSDKETLLKMWDEAFEIVAEVRARYLYSEPIEVESEVAEPTEDDMQPVCIVAGICQKSPARISQLCKEGKIHFTGEPRHRLVSVVSAKEHFARLSIQCYERENRRIGDDARKDAAEIEQDEQDQNENG